MNHAQRQNSLAALLSGSTFSGENDVSRTPSRDMSGVLAGEILAAASAPGACEGITLAPGSSPVGGNVATFGGGARRVRGDGDGGGTAGGKRRKLDGAGSTHHAPLLRRMESNGDDEFGDEPLNYPETPAAPTRLVGDIFFGVLGDVLGKVFNLKTSFGPTVSGATACEEGRERLATLAEELAKKLPDLSGAAEDASSDGGGVRGGRATREPTVDRTALNAEVDSVVVASKAAETAWRRYTEATTRAAQSARRAKVAAGRCDAAKRELAGAKIARDATLNLGDGSSLGAFSLDGFDAGIAREVTARVDAKIATLTATVAELAATVASATKEEAEARGQAATSSRAFKPPYDEVHKRALRLRLGAEERAERQIARALGRADHLVEHAERRRKDLEKRAAGKGAGKEKEAPGKGGAKGAATTNGTRVTAHATTNGEREAMEELAARAKIAREGQALLRRAADAAKTAIEWSKHEIERLDVRDRP
uniref:Uncharacterized protein n=1 Tax=Micromonas pusilla TaxID=38833 RepID=A0A7R9XVG9_MICPS